MKPYFDTPEKIAKLAYVCGLWNGTPWSANTESMGHGVACHNIPRAIYIYTGAVSGNFPVIIGDPSTMRNKKESPMEKFIDQRPEFQRLEIGRDKFAPGDLFGIRIGYCVDHLGVCLGDTFIHVLMHKKTSLDDRWSVPPWSQRINAAWRPVQ
jgi:hypothetical protein